MFYDFLLPTASSPTTRPSTIPKTTLPTSPSAKPDSSDPPTQSTTVQPTSHKSYPQTNPSSKPPYTRATKFPTTNAKSQTPPFSYFKTSTQTNLPTNYTIVTKLEVKTTTSKTNESQAENKTGKSLT